MGTMFEATFHVWLKNSSRISSNSEAFAYVLAVSIPQTHTNRDRIVCLCFLMDIITIWKNTINFVAINYIIQFGPVIIM